jgi:hypothetical protein
LTFGQAAVGRGSLTERITTNPARIYRLTESYLAAAQPLFVIGLVGWVGLALLEPLRVAWLERAGGRWARRLWEAVRRPAQLPIMVVGAGFLAFSVLDFQSGPDLLALIPLAGLGIGWWWLVVSDHLTPRRWLDATIFGGLAVCVALAGLGAIQLIQRPVGGQPLQQQIEAADALYTIVGKDADVQFFGCLTPLVVYQRQNATLFDHLGPKSVNLMAHEFGDIKALAALLEEKKTPALVLAGVGAGDGTLQRLIAGNYEKHPASPRICPDSAASEVWLRKAR